MKGFAAQFNQLFGELYECVKKSEQETLPGHQKLPLSAGEFHLLEQIDQTPEGAISVSDPSGQAGLRLSQLLPPAAFRPAFPVLHGGGTGHSAAVYGDDEALFAGQCAGPRPARILTPSTPSTPNHGGFYNEHL